MPGVHPGSASGIAPGGQGLIPRQSKRKKNFVTDARVPDKQMDRCDGGNSDVDLKSLEKCQSSNLVFLLIRSSVKWNILWQQGFEAVS